MERMKRRTPGLGALGALFVVVAAAGSWPGPVAAQGVTAAFVPAATTVTPGAEFELELRVTEAGAAFNGFRVEVAYDTSALTLLPLSPVSLQQGTLLTDACGTTFHRFRAGVGVDTISDILLCNGVSVTGPGQIYRLRFRAATRVRSTAVHIVDGSLKFYDAGLFVSPVSGTDALIGIGTDPVGVGDGATGSGLSLAVTPNPAHGRVAFTFAGCRAGPESLVVRDVQGRRVRRLDPGGNQAAWDGRDDAGRPVPNGTYFATLIAGGRSTTTRFSLLR
jgi:hypothetical protein